MRGRKSPNWRKGEKQLHSRTQWTYARFVNEKERVHVLTIPIMCTILHFQWTFLPQSAMEGKFPCFRPFVLPTLFTRGAGNLTRWRHMNGSVWMNMVQAFWSCCTLNKQGFLILLLLNKAVWSCTPNQCWCIAVCNTYIVHPHLLSVSSSCRDLRSPVHFNCWRFLMVRLLGFFSS